MTGRQTRFYAHPDHYPALAAGLRSLGAVAIDERTPTGLPVIQDIASLDSIWLFVVRHDDLAELRPRYSDPQQTWFYSSSKAPLIELHLMSPREGILRPGRVYFRPQIMADDESGLRLQDQPREFIAFVEGVRRWIRRWCEKREDLLLAPRWWHASNAGRSCATASKANCG